MKSTILLSIFLLFVSLVSGQEQPTSTIRGQVFDKHSLFPLPGASVVLIGLENQGTSTDANGYFRLENVPTGRQSISVSYISYETVTLGNLLVASGKELEVNVQLEESLNEIGAAEVVAQDDKREALNKMATNSARTVSVEEAQRYAGTLQDPARMAQNYAGVSGASDDRNDIIIRGNSPLGVLWRMEGIDIPSPNHFATLGSTGGPVSMLNINNLANSDFMTSAWSADYGNALSGVFDLKLRNGNPDKHEFLGQVGFNGFEAGAEGPLKKGKPASYIANYRYSTLGVVSALGVDLGTGVAVPEYQDLTFKLNLPTQNTGVFTVWGIGGVSFIEFAPGDEPDSTNLYASDTEFSRFESTTGVLGASHLYFFNPKTSSKLVVAASLSSTTGVSDTILSELGQRENRFGFDREQIKLSANWKLNKKINNRNTASFGIIADHYALDFLDTAYVQQTQDFRTISNTTGSAFLGQSYLNWQHRLNEQWTFNSGLHGQLFNLSNSVAIEPRLGVKFRPNTKHTWSLSGGLHSQTQPIVVYFNEEVDANGNVTTPNQNLDFNKSAHSVLGYERFIGNNMRIRAEAYYQYLYNVAVEEDSSAFSLINDGADFTLPSGTGFKNDGTGENYGFELTIEKFYANQYYFLVTTSLFESTYEGSDGIERNSAFNGNYVFNALGGKEINLGTNRTLGFDTKITLAGGRRYTPIDLEASRNAGSEIRQLDDPFSEQFEDYFRADFKITYRMNGKRASQLFSVDLQNISNNQNIFQYGYNVRTQDIGKVYQRGFFPNVTYQILF